MASVNGLAMNVDADAQLVAHLLQTLLVHSMPIRHRQYVRIPHIQLVLPQPTLTLAILHRYTARLQVPPERARVLLFARRLQQVVVLQVVADGCELGLCVLELVCGAVRLFVGVVLELAGAVHGVVVLGRTCDLLLQHAARGEGKQAVRLVVVDIAHHRRRLRLPTTPPQARQIRHEMKVAKPPLPIGERIARLWLHLHIVSQQVVTGVRAVLQCRVEEEVCVEALGP